MYLADTGLTLKERACPRSGRNEVNRNAETRVELPDERGQLHHVTEGAKPHDEGSGNGVRIHVEVTGPFRQSAT